VESHEETIDWDAAFEALVAPLRPPRYRRVARRVALTAVTLTFLMGTAWVLISLVAESLHDLGRPWL
jgi:hypothetical protein